MFVSTRVLGLVLVLIGTAVAILVEIKRFRDAVQIHEASGAASSLATLRAAPHERLVHISFLTLQLYLLLFAVVWLRRWN
jgi:hypothetical protein